MKRVLSILLSLLLALSILPAGALAEDTVVLSHQNLRADGKHVECEKYNIDGSNYFKLRDIAMILNGTGSQFSVGWDGEKKVISVVTGGSYEPNGSELDLSGGDKSATAVPGTQTLLIDGVERSDLSAWNIGGNNFFKLRDLGEALGFKVDYEKKTNTAVMISEGWSHPVYSWLCGLAESRGEWNEADEFYLYEFSSQGDLAYAIIFETETGTLWICAETEDRKFFAGFSVEETLSGPYYGNIMFIRQTLFDDTALAVFSVEPEEFVPEEHGGVGDFLLFVVNEYEIVDNTSEETTAAYETAAADMLCAILSRAESALLAPNGLSCADLGFTGLSDLSLRSERFSVLFAVLREADRYLSKKDYSRVKLIQQLEADGFSHEDAVCGVDLCGVKWRDNAIRSAYVYVRRDNNFYSKPEVASFLMWDGFTESEAEVAVRFICAEWDTYAVNRAKDHLESSAFSRSRLIELLEENGFTASEAEYGADHCGADWNQQAARKAEEYLKWSSYEKKMLIFMLESYDGFTHEQAVYGAERNGL